MVKLGLKEGVSTNIGKVMIKKDKPQSKSLSSSERLVCLSLTKLGFNIDMNKLTRQIYFEDSNGFGLHGNVTIEDNNYTIECPGYKSFMITPEHRLTETLFINLVEPLNIASKGLAQGLMMTLSESIDFDHEADSYVIHDYKQGVTVSIAKNSVAVHNETFITTMTVERYDFNILVSVYEWVRNTAENVL